MALPRLRQCPWPTLLDYLAARLPRIPRAEWQARLRAGHVVDDDGRALDEYTPYLHGQRVYYWRWSGKKPRRTALCSDRLDDGCALAFVAVDPVGPDLRVRARVPGRTPY